MAPHRPAVSQLLHAGCFAVPPGSGQAQLSMPGQEMREGKELKPFFQCRVPYPAGRTAFPNPSPDQISFVQSTESHGGADPLSTHERLSGLLWVLVAS